jgi:hypothetical protein
MAEKKMIQAPGGKMVPAPEGYDDQKPSLRGYNTDATHDGGFSVAPNPANAERKVFGVDQGDQDRKKRK